MKTRIHLRCLAYDGEAVIEGHDFESIEAAWARAEDMGSRWFFYPICIVTGDTKNPICIVTGDTKILDVPCGMDKAWIGKHLKSLVNQIKLYAASEAPDDQLAASRWVTCGLPCPFHP